MQTAAQEEEGLLWGLVREEGAPYGLPGRC